MCLKTEWPHQPKLSKEKPLILYNSPICSEKNSSENNKVSTNYDSGSGFRIKVKCLFDQGAQMIFLNKKKKKCFEFENNFSRETFD